MLRKIKTFITVICCLLMIPVSVYAEENTGCDTCNLSSDDIAGSTRLESGTEYDIIMDQVFESKEFKNYASILQSEMPLNVYKNEVNEDIQYTAAYLTSDGQTSGTLVFIMDENYDFEGIILTKQSENNIKVMDILNYNYEDYEIAPQVQGDCKTWQCTSRNVVGGGWSNPCVTLLGALCIASPAAVSAVCNLGVFVTCYTPVGIVCTGGRWVPVCEM